MNEHLFEAEQVNIGFDANRIALDMRQAVDDAQYWVRHSTYPSDEIAVRLSHGLPPYTLFRTAMGVSRALSTTFSSAPRTANTALRGPEELRR